MHSICDGHSSRVSMRRIRRFRNRLLAWYEDNGRCFPWRSPNVPTYRLVVTEILLQRTQAETVARAYYGFFRAFPSWRQLSQADEAQLMQHLRPLGLWRRRAASLLCLATTVAQNNGRLPTDRGAVEGLPAVGQYIANAIQLVRGLERAPLLDSGMARVLERHFGPRSKADIRHDAYLQELAWRVCDCEQSKELSWGILDLAAGVCKQSKPVCPACPLRRSCNRARGFSRARDDSVD
jgi:A/G-specific adenine glycosylase